MHINRLLKIRQSIQFIPPVSMKYRIQDNIMLKVNFFQSKQKNLRKIIIFTIYIRHF